MEATGIPIDKAAEKAIENMKPSVGDVVEKAKSLSNIKDNDSFLEADRYLSELKGIQKRLEDGRKKFTAPLDLVKKQIQDVFKPKSQLLVEAEMILKGATRKWFIAEQQKKAEEEQRRINEDRKRQEDENLAKAAEMEKQGNKIQAEKVMNQPTVDIKPKVQTSFDQGKSYGRKVWRCEIKNYPEFLKGIIDGKTSKAFLEINYSAMNRAAASMKGNINWPGVEVKEDVVMGCR